MMVYDKTVLGPQWYADLKVIYSSLGMRVE
jgi:hypothetical protein